MLGPNCLIIAGEKSGEEHAMSFLPELMKLCPDYKFWGVGGDELKTQGVDLIYHLKDFSSWGISEVISQIPFYLKAMKNLERLCEERQTKVAILVDFQTFNLKLAKRLKKKGIKVLYYVAPQAWAWKAYRAKTLSRCVHTLFTIIPFEKSWFMSRGVEHVRGVDHPLWRHYSTQISSRIPRKTFHEFQTEKKMRLLILPGSRNFEVSSLLPEFMKAARLLKDKFPLETSLVRSPSVKEEHFAPYLTEFNKIYSSDELSQALLNSDFCMAASGTVTLACALFELPTVVCYKTSKVNEFIFKVFINYGGYISLANIVHERKVFPELLQEKVTAQNIILELEKWMGNQADYETVSADLKKTKNLVQGELQDVSQYMAKVFQEAK